MTVKLPPYVLLTAAQNEEKFIEHVLRSVIGQGVLPVRWIVVSDGSTDRTDEIVQSYTEDHPWIELVRLPERKTRHFAGKAMAVNEAYSRCQDLFFEVVGNLDADVSFESDYIEYLLGKFGQDPKLGVAGTPYREADKNGYEKRSDHRHTHSDHVSGQVQLFRKSCFDDVGGYLPIKGGAIDWIAVTTARMRGWNTQSFSGKTFLHHREMGTASSGTLKARFHYGKKAYYVGGHPVWEILRGVFQMARAPLIFGGVMHQAGYLWAALTRMERPVSKELMQFHRSEQLSRLKRLVRSKKNVAPDQGPQG